MRELFLAALSAVVLSTSILMAPAWAEGLELPDGLRGDGKITLYRPVKNDRETFRYRKADGSYSEEAMDSIAHFFRCRLTDEAHPIDPQLIEILDAIEDHFGARELKLISAYRSPERNSLMRRRTRRVATESFHTKGMAADIELAGVSPWKVRDFAYFLNQGGVGYYSRRPFIHVDTGPLRTWGFKPRPIRSRTSPAMSQK